MYTGDGPNKKKIKIQRYLTNKLELGKGSFIEGFNTNIFSSKCTKDVSLHTILYEAEITVNTIGSKL